MPVTTGSNPVVTKLVTSEKIVATLNDEPVETIEFSPFLFFHKFLTDVRRNPAYDL
jgi:hypothetical protein